MMTVALLLALSAAPAERPTIALVGLKVVGVTSAEGELRGEELAQALSARGLNVMTPSAISAVLGFDRQKALLGCAETACVAELGAAMGAQALVLGNLGLIDGRYSLVLKLVSSKDAATLASWTVSDVSARALAKALQRGAWELVSGLSKHAGYEALAPTDAAPEVSEATTRGSLRPFALVPAIVGVAGVVVGAIFYGKALGNLNAIVPGAMNLETLASDGKKFEAIGWGGFIGGGVFLATAAVMFALGGSDSVTPIAWVDSHGGAFALSWRFQ